MGKKNKVSEWRKYDRKNQLWIPYFYIMYLYWWNFLKVAHQEKRNIDYSFYKDWGGKNMFDVSFKTWWKNNWKKLFSQKQQIPDEEIKYPMTTTGKNANAIKVALEVYRNKHKDNWDIVIDLQKKYPTNMGAISGQGATDTKEVNRTIKRYRKNADKILDNVCKGIFP